MLGSTIPASCIATMVLDTWYPLTPIPPCSSPEITHVTNFDPNLPVGEYLDLLGWRRCISAANEHSRDDNIYESTCRFVTTVPLPVPSSSRSVNIMPTFCSPQLAATWLIVSSSCHGRES